MDRRRLGIIVVVLDIVITSIVLLAIWTIQYLVKVDAERHKNLLFETQEFSIMINNLPQVKSDQELLILKAELWEHIQGVVKD